MIYHLPGNLCSSLGSWPEFPSHSQWNQWWISQCLTEEQAQLLKLPSHGKTPDSTLWSSFPIHLIPHCTGKYTAHPCACRHESDPKATEVLGSCLSAFPFPSGCLIYYLLHLHINKHYTFKSVNLDNILTKHLVLCRLEIYKWNWIYKNWRDIWRQGSYPGRSHSAEKTYWHHPNRLKSCSIWKSPVLQLH